MKLGLIAILLTTVACMQCVAATSAGELSIYFIDVEGGQATLLVTPGGQSLLIDAGFPAQGTFESRPGKPELARDPNRVVAAAHDAGVTRIDFLLNTHFHGDHMGGIPELAQLLPVGTFVDHGKPLDSAEMTSPGTLALFAAYDRVRSKGRHLDVKPGDRVPLKDINVRVVSSGGDTLTHALPGAGSQARGCNAPAVRPGEPNENPRSTGVLITFGKFRFLDVGDLTGDPLHRLACPTDLIGRVDVYLVAHHGGSDAADPALFETLRPRVAVMNNGQQKGGSVITYELLHRVMAAEDTWQLHRSEAAGDQNFSETQIANLDESTAYWIKLSARPNGSFTVFNGRTKVQKAYPAP